MFTVSGVPGHMMLSTGVMRPVIHGVHVLMLMRRSVGDVWIVLGISH
jgi:hypothetical protein